MVSIKDIARAVGTSPSSVSFVLNGKGAQNRISESLADRIKSMAEQMGYTPNRVAISLRTGQSKTIGLIVENIANSFFSSLAKTIEDELRSFGYNVVYCSTENDASRGTALLKMLYDQQVDGYLITPTQGMQGEIKRLLAQGKPVVLIDRYLTEVECPYVLTDNYGGMQQATKYLIDGGYRTIGYINIDIDLIQMKERLAAFKETLLSAGLPFKKKQLLTLSYSDSREQSIENIKVHLQGAKDIDALIFATNYLGVYGLESIRALKLKIPDDIAVLCFDDNILFQLHFPRITAVEQPVTEIANKATKILLGQLGLTKKLKQEKLQLPAKLIVRESV